MVFKVWSSCLGRVFDQCRKEVFTVDIAAPVVSTDRLGAAFVWGEVGRAPRGILFVYFQWVSFWGALEAHNSICKVPFDLRDPQPESPWDGWNTFWPTWTDASNTPKKRCKMDWQSISTNQRSWQQSDNSEPQTAPHLFLRRFFETAPVIHIVLPTATSGCLLLFSFICFTDDILCANAKSSFVDNITFWGSSNHIVAEWRRCGRKEKQKGREGASYVHVSPVVLVLPLVLLPPGICVFFLCGRRLRLFHCGRTCWLCSGRFPRSWHTCVNVSVNISPSLHPVQDQRHPFWIIQTGIRYLALVFVVWAVLWSWNPCRFSTSKMTCRSQPTQSSWRRHQQHEIPRTKHPSLAEKKWTLQFSALRLCVVSQSKKSENLDRKCFFHKYFVTFGSICRLTHFCGQLWCFRYFFKFSQEALDAFECLNIECIKPECWVRAKCGMCAAPFMIRSKIHRGVFTGRRRHTFRGSALHFWKRKHWCGSLFQLEVCGKGATPTTCDCLQNRHHIWSVATTQYGLQSFGSRASQNLSRLKREHCTWRKNRADNLHRNAPGLEHSSLDQLSLHTTQGAVYTHSLAEWNRDGRPSSREHRLALQEETGLSTLAGTPTTRFFVGSETELLQALCTVTWSFQDKSDNSTVWIWIKPTSFFCTCGLM